MENECTAIRDAMRITGRKIWGLVIYRCTYADDAAWSTFLDILNERVRENLAIFPSEDTAGLWETLDWRVESDAATLDGVSKADIRARFNAWVASDEAVAEQGSNSMSMPEMFEIGALFPRHIWCMHVDAESLESVVKAAPRPPTPDREAIGYVNLIQSDWEMPENREDYGNCEPIEGCTLYNVGWMKVSLESLAPALYAALQKDDVLDVVYVRPPEVCIE